MNIGFPINTIVMILATMLASGIGAWFILSQVISRLAIAQRVKQSWRWGAAFLLGAWLLARLALAANPPAGGLATQFLITFISLGLGLLAGILPLLLSPDFRQAVRAVPETWLVGLHAVRIAGFLFLALLDMNLLPAEFALSAGYGDILVGLLALGMVYLLAQRKPYARAVVTGWNALGLLDFVSALLTGGLFIVPFAAQIAESGASLLYLNFVLIVPSFGVPLYALLHIYSLYQMFSGRVGETRLEAGEPVQIPVFQGEQR